MAEIGIVASIFGVAAFGTKVAKSLYETGEVMIHAHQQIASMAKHVSQFTAVLRHLGRVLEAEKGNCSKDLLRDIQKLKHSCKRTFKEIHATIRSRRLRPFIPVQWLFKKGKAKELEARLDSQQSMLQTMIQSVTVSKLGDIQSRSKEDSEQISILRQEIDLLKALIVENYKSAAELRRAEQYTEAEARQSYFPDSDAYNGLRVPSPKPSSDESSSSDSDNEIKATTRASGQSELQLSPMRNDQERSEALRNHMQKENSIEASAVQQLPALGKTPQTRTHQASTLLLQMIPYRPIPSDSNNLDRSGHLITLGSNKDTDLANDAKPPMEGATKIARLLLDKWTTSGSGPVAAILDENQTQEDRKKQSRTADDQAEPRAPSMSPLGHFWEDESGSKRYFPSFHDRPPPTMDIWRTSHVPQHLNSRYVQDFFVKAIRSTGGGILYTKRSDFQCLHYVDQTVVCRLRLVPPWLIPLDEPESLFTERGKGWVRQEALDLLGHTYSETQSGHFCVSGNLEFSEIEELVRLSYQGFYRGLEKFSSQTIDERGWRKGINILNQEVPINDPGAAHTFPPPSNDGRHPSVAYPYGHIKKEAPLSNLDTSSYSGSSVPPPEISGIPKPAAAHNNNSERKASGVQRTKEGKPIQPDLRYTLPHRTPTFSFPNIDVQLDTTPEMDASALELKLQQARDKLEQLMEKRDEAKKAKNTMVASDLTYHAIPDMRWRIEELERGKQENEEQSFEHLRAHARPTEVETDSSRSRDGESQWSTRYLPRKPMF